MRYRREIGIFRIAYWFAWPAILVAGLLRRGHPIWLAVLAGLAALLLSVTGYLFWYWEVLPDRVVHRRYWNALELPFTDIAYVGPVTGTLARNPRTRAWIEVQNTSGRRMLVDSAKPEAFLAEMRTHLPQVTLNL